MSDSAVREYQDIYRRTFGSKITAEEAKAQGEKLLRVFRIIYRPIPDQIQIDRYETKQT